VSWTLSFLIPLNPTFSFLWP